MDASRIGHYNLNYSEFFIELGIVGLVVKLADMQRISLPVVICKE